MSKGKQKMLFEVQENETIDMCLDRIKKAGYMPVRRTEKPIFEEIKNGGTVTYEPVGRQIIFEAKVIQP
ncbi:NETI motif-containing protein [Cytobacillus praedii]|uniref:NETI motif-containing protein n=1 Tax=Cytobacillus praedii TaxID=1742358 RepID=A0A4R1AW50_9BACI|nr:NETI motif-containing protein [Cytobacillus praedii]MED3552869.1 NETI motif-containing protein [Cytobacillus praedii]TCJ01757.1 NETI motif-containing protein [Cytobacillus praedii]